MLNVGDHPNVLKVIGCCTTMKPIMLVTEFLKYGDLLHFLWDSREVTKCDKDPAYHVTEKSLLQMAHQVATGMDYLTKSRIIHGDLAARNILVGEELTCKISDFGLANDVYRYGAIHGKSERCVPFKWISPERMMAGKLPITSKSDVWSFGNLMYEMITLGCMPHPDIESDKLLNKLKD
uniref:Protein kinase domain-containing protein n=1 Tax=Ciona savignyi TaxID=51511 RepID=H2Y4U1_CIOSA